jgi:hypothetical protein
LLPIDAGADVNAEGGLGTPLSQAAWADRTRGGVVIAYRARRKGNQAVTEDGYTALHFWAASTGGNDVALTKLLVDHGANPNSATANVDVSVGTVKHR